MPDGTTLPTTSTQSGDWLDHVLESLRDVGYCVLTDAVEEPIIGDVRDGLMRARAAVIDRIGPERLQRSSEKGVIRAPMLFDPVFFRLLELPAVLQVIDRTVGETAVLHLQNGFVLPPAEDAPGESFQETFHPDFPRYMNGYVASINALMTVDAFTAENGGTVVVPGSQQRATRPAENYMAARAVPVTCPPGSIVFFDSTLWHAAGRNSSTRDRMGVNMQFTRSFFKQQIDYVRCLGDEVVCGQPPRTQQLLGWYTWVVASLDEYYQPPEKRLYRSGQG